MPDITEELTQDELDTITGIWRGITNPLVRARQPWGSQAQALPNPPSVSSTRTTATLSPPEALTSSESNEWYTPPRIMEYVKNVIGDQYLDPAASEDSLRINPASFHYTEQTNGLEQSWAIATGISVFLNPPFGKEGTRSRAGIWLDKMYEKYEAGEFEHGIALTHTRPGYEWWESMSRKVPICMARQKIDFIPADPARPTTGSKTAQTFFYFGRDILRFTEVFSELGRILIPVPDMFHGEIAVSAVPPPSLTIRPEDTIVSP